MCAPTVWSVGVFLKTAPCSVSGRLTVALFSLPVRGVHDISLHVHRPQVAHGPETDSSVEGFKSLVVVFVVP